MVEVQLGTAEGALQIVRIGCEPVELLVNAGLVGMVVQFEAGADAIEQIRVLCRGETRNLCRLFRGLRLDHERGLGRGGCEGLRVSAARTIGEHGAHHRLRLRDLFCSAFGGRMRAGGNRQDYRAQKDVTRTSNRFRHQFPKSSVDVLSLAEPRRPGRAGAPRGARWRAWTNGAERYCIRRTNLTGNFTLLPALRRASSQFRHS